MRHTREHIHLARHSLTEYGAEVPFVREVADIIESKFHLAGGWKTEDVIDEGYAQAITLLLDFDERIFFDNTYYNEALSRMPISVASAAFGIAYVLIDSFEGTESIKKMILDKFSSKTYFRALKSLTQKHYRFKLYPCTPYFANSDYVDWNILTNGFRPNNVKRVLSLAKEYEWPSRVAKSLLGHLRAFAISNDRLEDPALQESEQFLRDQLTQDQILQVYIGDEFVAILDTNLPIVLEDTAYRDSPTTLAELNKTREELSQLKKEIEEKKRIIAQVQSENVQKMKESQGYKDALDEVEKQLGRSHISLNKIAECIMRFPTPELQYKAFQDISSVLTGTAWSEKAAEVMEQMFSKVKKQSVKFEVNVGTLNNNGVINEISGSSVQIEGGSASKPQIEQ